MHKKRQSVLAFMAGLALGGLAVKVLSASKKETEEPVISSAALPAAPIPVLEIPSEPEVKLKPKRLLTLGNGLFVLATLFLLFFIILQTLPIKQGLSIVGYKPLIVKTDSMTGKLDIGDIVVIQSLKDDLQAGDIITFYAPTSNGSKEIVTHFIAEVLPDHQYRTKPNITERWDSWIITQDDIIGEYSFSIPKLGYIVIYLHDPAVIGTVLAVACVLIAVFLMIKPAVKERDDTIGSNGEEK